MVTFGVESKFVGAFKCLYSVDVPSISAANWIKHRRP